MTKSSITTQLILLQLDQCYPELNHPVPKRQQRQGRLILVRKCIRNLCLEYDMDKLGIRQNQHVDNTLIFCKDSKVKNSLFGLDSAVV